MERGTERFKLAYSGGRRRALRRGVITVGTRGRGRKKETEGGGELIMD